MQKFLDIRTPQAGMTGRLTYVTNTPVMISNDLANTLVFYSPFNGEFISTPNGRGGFDFVAYSELSNDSTQSATGKAGPAAVANNSIYDFFVWNDAGTIRLTRGPAWTNDTTRSAGTALTRKQGVWVNSLAITNGPGSQLGVYVGSARSNGTATFDFNIGTSAAGGGEALITLWNIYNRVQTAVRVIDSNTSFTYGTNTIRALDNSNGNRFSFLNAHPVAGGGEATLARLHCPVTTAASAGAIGRIGLELDATTTVTEEAQVTAPTANALNLPVVVIHTWRPQFGYHFIQAVERGDGATTTTYNSIGTEDLHGSLWY